MRLLHRVASVLRWMFNRIRAEADLDDEVQAFLEMAADDASARRCRAGRGAPPGGPAARRRGTGEGTGANRPPRRMARRGRRATSATACGSPPQSVVLGDRHRDAGARHRRDYGDVQRLRHRADPSAALHRRGSPRDDLARHEQEGHHVETQRHAGGVDRVAASQHRLHGPRVHPACRRDAVRRRRARTGSGAQSHLDLLERAGRAADCSGASSQRTRTTRACASSSSATGSGSGASAARRTSSDARSRSTTSRTK